MVKSWTFRLKKSEYETLSMVTLSFRRRREYSFKIRYLAIASGVDPDPHYGRPPGSGSACNKEKMHWKPCLFH